MTGVRVSLSEYSRLRWLIAFDERLEEIATTVHSERLSRSATMTRLFGKTYIPFSSQGTPNAENVVAQSQGNCSCVQNQDWQCDYRVGMGVQAKAEFQWITGGNKPELGHRVTYTVDA